MRPFHRYSLLFALVCVSCSGPTGEVTKSQLVEPTPVAKQPQPVGLQADEPPPPPPPAPKLRLPNSVRPVEYRAALTIDPDAEVFSGVIDIDISILERTSHLWLNATDIDIDKANLQARGRTFNVERLPTSTDHFLGFALGATLPAGSATLHLEYRGKMSEKDYHGLLRREDRDTWYIYSHFEPLAARRAFPSFDEPRFKVPWQLTINAKDGHVAFTNTPLVEQKAGPKAGWQSFRFARSKPLPSYLVALAVGPFETADVGKIGRNKVPTRIIVPKGRVAEARYAVEATPKLVEALEDYFDMPYPYAKLDSIAVPRFGGAMENPGLITYNLNLLLSEPDKETHGFHRRYSGVGAHELAHQWFGDLVTMDWWDDIWLNESFATWMATKMVTKLYPEWNNDIYRVRQLDVAIGSDSSATSKPVRRPIASNSDIETAFDRIAYQKGAAVIAMFERLISEDKFRTAMRNYMRTHAWDTSTSKDFLAAISQVSAAEVPTAFATFLEQPGVPMLSVTRTCAAGKTPELSIAQERMLPAGSNAKSDQLWHIPVCVKYGKGKKIAETCTLMKEKQASVALGEVGGCPDWVQANSGASGYYRVAYAKGMLANLLKKGSKHLAPAERVAVVGDMNALVSTSKIGIGEALAQIPTLLASRDPHVIQRAASVARRVSHELIPRKLKPNYKRFIYRMFRARARKLGLDHKKGDSQETKDLRRAVVGLVISRGEDQVLIKQAVQKAKTWLDKRTGIDREMLSLVLSTAAEHGGKKLFERMVAELDKDIEDPGEQRALISAVASTTDRERIIKNMEMALSGKLSKLGMRSLAPMLFIPLGDPDTRGVVYEYLKSNYDAVLEKLPKMAHRFILRMPSAFCDKQHYDDVKAFFGPKAEKIPGGDQSLAKTLESIELCMAFRTAQQPSVEAFLKKY